MFRAQLHTASFWTERGVEKQTVEHLVHIYTPFQRLSVAKNGVASKLFSLPFSEGQVIVRKEPVKDGEKTGQPLLRLADASGTRRPDRLAHSGWK